MARETILVVDDNPANTKLVSFLLAARGYVVRTASTADQAVAAVAGERPDLILMDLQLPGMDGLTLTRKLKTDPATREIVIVAFTAYAMRGDEETAYEAGCDGYITKPIDTRLLPAQLAEYLAGNGRQQKERP